jgi:hypothetical protein
MLLVFDRGVFQLARRNRKRMERLSDRDSGNRGTDRFGEADTTALAARSDPSVAIRMFLNNAGLLLLFFLSDEIAKNQCFGGCPKRFYQKPGIPQSEPTSQSCGYAHGLRNKNVPRIAIERNERVVKFWAASQFALDFPKNQDSSVNTIINEGDDNER